MNADRGRPLTISHLSTPENPEVVRRQPLGFIDFHQFLLFLVSNSILVLLLDYFLCPSRNKSFNQQK